MIGIALKQMGFTPLVDFELTDPVGNGDEKDFILNWLSNDKPEPKLQDIKAVIETVKIMPEPEPIKSIEDRVAALEAAVALL